MATPFLAQPHPPSQTPPVKPPEPVTGWFEKNLINPLVEWLESNRFLNWIKNLFISIVGWVLGAILKLSVEITVFWAKTIGEGELRATDAYNKLVIEGVADLLSVETSEVAGIASRDKAARRDAQRAAGQAIIRALFGDYTGATAREIGPSAAQAERFMTAVATLAMEGWLWGWVAEACSLGAIEKFGDLDDIIAEALGIGRLSRRVLGPPMSILVEQPFTWLLNRTFRPTQLGASELIRQYWRGRATRERVFRELSWMGYKDDDIEALLATHQRFLSDTDLVYLVEAGVWTREQAIQHLRDQGYPEETARATLELERQRRIDTYRRKAADAAIDAFVRQDIDEAQLRRVLAGLGLPEWEQQWMRTVAAFQREFRSKDLTLSDMEQAVKRGILSINDFRAYCLKQGYSLEDARTLELLLLTEIRDKEAADAERRRLAEERERERQRRLAEQEQRRQQVAQELEQRQLSLSQIEQLVRRGLRTLDDYREWLRNAGYTPQDVADLAELLSQRIADERAEAERREQLAAQAARRRLSLSDLEKAVKLGLMSVDEYRSQLAAAGFSDEDRALLARILQRELDRAAEEAARREEARRKLAERQISLDDLERAVRLGLRTVDDYHARLIAEGFSDEDADLLAELLRHQIADDNAARERRAKVEAQLKRRKISLNDWEKAVRAGIRTIAEYRGMLMAEGYSDADANLLSRLLELQIQADRDAAERRRQAAERLATRHISLDDLERAVVLGIVSMDYYRDVLHRQGFSAEDQRILTGLLAQNISDYREKQRTRAAAQRTAQRRGISLDDLERAVRLGIRSMAEYQATLAQLGFTAQDQATLVALLEYQMAQDRAAQARRDQIEQEVARRGLSLAQMERAVLEGIQTLQDYYAFLRQQGYSQQDAQILGALLELRLAARQQAG
jgi:hypothetical protein